MMGSRSLTAHNGGPALDDEENGPPTPRYCAYCRHWSLPTDWDVRAYEAFQLGPSRRRVKRPTGTCDRVFVQYGKPLAFSATTDPFGCLNFSAKPSPPLQRGRGFVTITRSTISSGRGTKRMCPSTIAEPPVLLCYDPSIPAVMETPMPKNRQTFHDPLDELPPVTIEIVKGNIMRFTQVDRDGRTNVVTFSDCLAVRRGVFDRAKTKVRAEA